MKLKIVSDGNPVNTQVFTEDGKKIENIRSITWHCEAGKVATLTIEIILIETDLTGEYDGSEYELVDVSGLGEKYCRTIFVKKEAG